MALSAGPPSRWVPCSDPSLYPTLFTLSRRRMHLIALASAHWPGEINALLARLLIRGVPNAKLRMVSVSPLLMAESRKMA